MDKCHVFWQRISLLVPTPDLSSAVLTIYHKHCESYSYYLRPEHSILSIAYIKNLANGSWLPFPRSRGQREWRRLIRLNERKCMGHPGAIQLGHPFARFYHCCASKPSQKVDLVVQDIKAYMEWLYMMVWPWPHVMNVEGQGSRPSTERLIWWQTSKVTIVFGS